CVAYEEMERFFPVDKIILTGNPVRANILNCELTQQQAKEQLGFDPSRKLVLVVGGSLGARTINDSVAIALDQIIATGAQVMWQTGKIYAQECSQIAQGKNGVIATAFISDMNVAYRAADLVVSRAGAGTISELQLLGMPVLLVPSPNVAEDHQRKNAQALVDKNAAVMLLDADCRS
ncbi:MAG: UDP-N-acetylglucosamine--N-acetylmuramyl-(pentapeptide) pyrophosphoryl-undecaprenol N-acetylglucosamine transferase, partial [Muribaculaceae bacterium]|nr:UDP-N-acetylglucosamine--N-acetylmuramyl-(pentapeptide) pyrophosphoryl-undecaprenol N-acetylglucosamine transferase [Muribaculaceae bacterium]